MLADSSLTSSFPVLTSISAWMVLPSFMQLGGLACPADQPLIDKYIFPGGYLPNLEQITRSVEKPV